MGHTPLLEELVSALASAGAAHHDYESHFLGGVQDEQWPGWYAAYVLGRLGDFTSPTALSSWLQSIPLAGEWTQDAASYVVTQLKGQT
jgi:hypothetical protein